MADCADVDLSPDQVRTLAQAAGLSLTDEELSAITPQLNTLRQGIARLSELGLDDVEPAVTFDPRQPGAH